MDILKIRNINQEHIFFDDDTDEKTTINKLMDIVPLIKNNMEFYSRMLQECNTFFDESINKLHNMECPEESKCQGVLGVNNLIKRENYIRESYEISGINRVYNYAFNQFEHWYKLYNQINQIINVK
jgi:hypothetical protein